MFRGVAIARIVPTAPIDPMGGRNSDRGVLLCATKDVRYLMQAYLAARSARRCLPEFSVALFTDRPGHPLVGTGVFDMVIPIEVKEEFRSAWVTGKFPRLRALCETPYWETLHVDCDARIVHQRASSIFDELGDKEIAFAECHSDTSFTCRQIGRRVFNAGVIAYRRTTKVMQLFERWESLTRHHHNLAELNEPRGIKCLERIEYAKTRRRLLGMDQLSLLQLLSPETNVFDLDVHVLHESWNSRKRGRSWEAFEPVKIDHSPAHHDTVCPDLLLEANCLEQAGQSAAAQVLYDAVQEISRLDDIYVSRKPAADGAYLRQLLTTAKRTVSSEGAELALRATLHALHGQVEQAFMISTRAAAVIGVEPPKDVAVVTMAVLDGKWWRSDTQRKRGDTKQEVRATERQL